MSSRKPLELGLIVGLGTVLSEGPVEVFGRVAGLGLSTCQLSCWKPELYGPEAAAAVVEASRQTGVRVSALWAGCSGRYVWDFIEGPTTIGLVPRKLRAHRTRELIRGAEFADRIGTPAIATHVGFIPDDPASPDYRGTVEATRKVAQRCQHLGQTFMFETGQETPVTLLRTIEDVALPNLGVNYDPANLLLYGKANPVDGLDVIGRYVTGVHAKDGEYPTDGRHLGQEKPLGKGRVNFPLLIARLKKLGYRGPLTIEREIRGPQQIVDIKKAVRVLRPLC